MESNKRKDSAPNADSQSEIGDCILCQNPIRFWALGVCGHRDVCHTCSLRMRIILEDDQCPICKAELDEVVITDDRELTWSRFDKKFKHKAEEDPVDDTVYYHNEDAKRAAM